MLTPCKYNPNQHPSLPPGCDNNPIQYTLTFQMTNVYLLQISPRPIYIKMSIWGISKDLKMLNKSPFIFNIRTNGSLLKEYLQDMKVIVIKLYDTRNNQLLGTGVMNWNLYLNKVQDKNNQYVPFLENIFQSSVKIFNHKKKLISEVQLTIKLEIFDQEQQSFYKNSKKKSSFYQQQQKQQSKKKNYPSNQMKQRKSGMMVKDIDKSISEQSEEFKINNSEIDSNIKMIYSKPNKTKIPLLNAEEQQKQGKKLIRYPQSKYQLEKAQLKLQAEQFLSLTKKQHQQKPSNNHHNSITVKISDFVAVKSNAVIEFIDVFVLSGKQNSLGSTQNNQKRHMRVFGSGKEGNNFTAEVVMKNENTLEIQVGKGLAKGMVQAKVFKYKQSVNLTLYSRNGKFGYLNVIKLSEHNKSFTKKQPSTFPRIPSPNKTKIQLSDQNNIPKKVNQNFLLINLKQAKYNSIFFDIAIKNYLFNKPYPSSNIIPLSELGTFFAIQFRNQQNQTLDSITITNYHHIQIINENLRCIGLQNKQFILKNGMINIQILMGTMKQINYQLANQYRNYRYYEQTNKQFVQSKEIIRKDKAFTQGSNQNKKQKISQIDKYQIVQGSKYTQFAQRNQQQNSQQIHKTKNDQEIRVSGQDKLKIQSRKIHTNKEDRFPPNESGDINRSSQLTQQDNHTYLVQMLSKFLHALPIDKMTQTSPTSVQQFQQLLNHLLTGHDEKQLIQIVIDMFIDDTSVEQGHPPKLQYDQFIKCIQGYHNFLQLQWKIRISALSQIIQLQPDVINRISHYSQLGMISKQILWKKALNKVNNPQLMLQIDKMYNLNSPISANFLIEDLKKTQNNPTMLTSEVTPELIMSLGKLIKQTIQQILQGSNLDPPSIPEDKVNIRIMRDTLQRLNITLSYWESLMLIQELKGWYSIDLDLNEGIISGSTLQVWLKSVLNRSVIEPKKQISSAVLKQKQLMRASVLSQNKSQKSQTIQKQQLNNIQKSINIKNKMITQNKSAIKSQLNQQQIFYIANLLKQNDDFKFGLNSLQKPISRDIQKQFNKGQQKFLFNNNILDKLNSQQCQSIHKKTQQMINKQLTQIKPQQKLNYLFIKIKALRLKIALTYPIKFIMKIYDTKQHYYLCNSIDQIQGRQLVEQLFYNWYHKSKGLRVQIIKPNLNQQQQTQRQILIHGILLSDDISQMFQNQCKTKTIVLYSNKQIVGKLTLQIQLTLNKPQLSYIDKKTKIQIQITPQLKHQKQWQYFQVKTVELLQQITVKQCQNNILPCVIMAKNQQYQLDVNGTFYKESLIVKVEGVGMCIVPLQQLYFKSQLIGEYPMIGEQGLFMGNIQIRLSNPNGITKANNMTMLQIQVPNKEKHQLLSKQKYLIIFDTISTLLLQPSQNSTQFQVSILSNIYVKDAINRLILFRSPFYIEHKHPKYNNYSYTNLCQYSADNFCIIQAYTNNKQVTIQLQYNGRHVGIGDFVINLQQYSRNNCKGSRLNYSLKYVGSSNARIMASLGIRVIPIPLQFDKYNVNRIYKALAKHKYMQQQQDIQEEATFLDSIIKDANKLTVTQQRLLKQMTKDIHGAIYVNLAISQIKHVQLTRDFLNADQIKCGRLGRNQVQQIVSRVAGTDYSRKVLDVFYNCYGVSQSATSASALMKIQSISYMMLLQFTYPLTSAIKKLDDFSFDNQLSSNPIIAQVDKLHKQIQQKYAIK